MADSRELVVIPFLLPWLFFLIVFWGEHRRPRRWLAPRRRFGAVIPAIVGPSEYLRRVFVDHGYRARVIPNVVDTARYVYRERTPPERPGAA